jgi:hypothetical protein
VEGRRSRRKSAVERESDVEEDVELDPYDLEMEGEEEWNKVCTIINTSNLCMFRNIYMYIC